MQSYICVAFSWRSDGTNARRNARQSESIPHHHDRSQHDRPRRVRRGLHDVARYRCVGAGVSHSAAVARAAGCDGVSGRGKGVGGVTSVRFEEGEAPITNCYFYGTIKLSGLKGMHA